MTSGREKYVKVIPESTEAYARLKVITDAAQAGILTPWSPAVTNLLDEYGLDTRRLKDLKAQATLTFPTSIEGHRSMAIGFKYAKEDGTSAEDLFVFIEDVGLTAYYRGTQEEYLPEYAHTHHQVLDPILVEALPDIHQKIASLQGELDKLKDSQNVEFISDIDFANRMQALAQKQQRDTQNLISAHNITGSGVELASRAVQQEITKERQQLRELKRRSDVAYKPLVPELSVQIDAQANKNTFNFHIGGNGDSLVLTRISINGVVTDFNQVFKRLFSPSTVNYPDGIFDNDTAQVNVEIDYRTSGKASFKYRIIGLSQAREDGRFNILFPNPPEYLFVGRE